MTKLIIVRHGESLYNLERRYTGQTDVPLTEKGRTQAALTAKYVLENYKIDSVYASDLVRAIDTARPVAEPLGLFIKTDPRLREIYAGKWQGVLFAEVCILFKEDYELYKADKNKGRTTGGESMLDVRDRVYAALTDIAKENSDKTVFIATHNGPLMAMQSPICNVDINDVQSTSNNSVTELLYKNGSFEVVKFNYTEHLGDLITSFKNKSHN